MKPVLTRAERIGKERARIMRDNSTSRFCTPFAHDANGINTVALLDKDKTQSLKRASI